VIRIAVIALALAACSPAMQTVRLVNRTDRGIAEIYVYPTGAARGRSRGELAPNATLELKIGSGNVEVLARSVPIPLPDTHQIEHREATQTIELKGPLLLVFHDSDQKPAELARPGTLGVTFRITPPDPNPPQSDPR
jgi:hypothetical protein